MMSLQNTSELSFYVIGSYTHLSVTKKVCAVQDAAGAYLVRTLSVDQS